MYTDASAADGGWHEGDMRQRIGKELVSIGINHANYGIHSTKGPSPRTPFSCAQVTAHNSRGMYRNGVKNHGYSGGNSIVTLHNFVGNEFSHELGHNYNLGHYPNGFAGSVHHSSEHFGSSWGWDSEKNAFNPNFKKAITGEFACLDGTCQDPFFGHKFGYASMGGGGGSTYLATNHYTLHTPYELEQIQKYLEKKAVFHSNSTTGYKAWNDDCKCMREWLSTPVWTPQIQPSPTQCSSLDSMKSVLSQYSKIRINFRNGYWNRDIYVPAASSMYDGKIIHVLHHAGFYSNLHMGSKTIKVSYGQELIFVGKEDRWEQIDSLPGELDVDHDNPRTPAVQGVPVTTLLGYYDPEGELESFVYPALHGAYGNTFVEDVEGNTSGCSATIRSSTGRTLSYALKGYRQEYGNMNTLHINVAESFEPQNISISCNGSTLVQRDISGPTKTLSYTVNGRPL